ncbi:hypothetical protein COHA_010005 [Chlorella ohadii]|uniref:Ubiquitin-fold modifier-conjugating enzyme 1 n=1 Tax=Chlorella ohadii TaxID=2649997 RepID=A0AAD5H019_9CHLO|nr:hypothetical protein COHA_010005 [Chlorella ohadii]
MGDASWDPTTRATVQKIPLLTVKAGPRDKEEWQKRLKEELQALIKYIEINKASDLDWFTIKPSNKEGTHWAGKCWYVHELIRYEFDFQFDIPATYPTTAPEIELPELEGKTAKMYRGGKICLTIHFKPLWAKNSPHFGIAHALCLGLAPWLAAEVPYLVETGVQQPSSRSSSDSPGKRIVITGGSKGLGLAMAREFLGCYPQDTVALCGRNAEQLEAALADLRRQFGAERVHGTTCDVSSPQHVSRLGEFVGERLGGVDLWINNAGEVTAKRLLADVEAGEVVRVVGTNVIGSLLGSQQAVRLMRQQPAAAEPAYHIFNCGFSKWGAKLTKSAVTHKATKRALSQLMESLGDELREAGLTSIGVHNLSPGMLLTDLLLKDSTPVSRRFFNALAEEPETVAAVIVPQASISWCRTTGLA